MDKSEQMVVGARAVLVDNRQKRILIMAAKEAWAAQQGCGMVEVDDDFEQWRKGVCWDVCGKASFRILNQREYGLVLGELRGLAGTVAVTRRQRLNERVAQSESGEDGDRRRALFLLREACRESADVFGGYEGACSYAAAILQRTHKLPVGGEWRLAAAKQLIQTMFTVKARAKAKLRKRQEGL